MRVFIQTPYISGNKLLYNCRYYIDNVLVDFFYEDWILEWVGVPNYFYNNSVWYQFVREVLNLYYTNLEELFLDPGKNEFYDVTKTLKFLLFSFPHLSGFWSILIGFIGLMSGIWLGVFYYYHEEQHYVGRNVLPFGVFHFKVGANIQRKGFFHKTGNIPLLFLFVVPGILLDESEEESTIEGRLIVPIQELNPWLGWDEVFSHNWDHNWSIRVDIFKVSEGLFLKMFTEICYHVFLDSDNEQRLCWDYMEYHTGMLTEVELREKMQQFTTTYDHIPFGNTIVKPIVTHIVKPVLSTIWSYIK